MPMTATAIPARKANVSAASPIRWNSIMTAMSRFAPNNATTPDEKTTCPIWLNASVSVLK
jgi:hypothetical protein